jgi:hypothetical protein
MTTAVTDQLLRDLVVGSHAEGTTCLAVAAAIEYEHRVLPVAGTGERKDPSRPSHCRHDFGLGERRARGRGHLPRRRAPGVSAKTTPEQRHSNTRLPLDSTRPRAFHTGASTGSGNSCWEGYQPPRKRCNHRISGVVTLSDVTRSVQFMVKTSDA